MTHAEVDEVVMGRRVVGWYADPITVGAARYWNGRGWTDRVSWGGAVSHDPTPLREVERRAALAEIEVVSDYLEDAARRQVVAPAVVAALRLDVEQRASGRGAAATISAPSQPTERLEPATTIAARPSTAAARADLLAPPETSTLRETPARFGPPPAVAVPAAPIPIAPGRLAQWWDDARHAVRSDLALHGLAYLGVLLLFAGVTGLIAFSFGDVDPWVRATAELLVPSALFVSAWYLHRRNAVVVSAALTLLGGAILPIVVTASMTDGAPVPPDLSGRALPIVQGLAVALVAAGMVLVVRRSPSSPLRFLAGPVLWMAAGLAAGAARNPVPAGYETARPDSLQLSVILAALAATVLLCRWRGVPAALADATRAAALPVAGVVYVLELVLAGDAGWPIAGTIIGGLAVLSLLELSVKRLTADIASGVQMLVVAVAAARLSAQLSPEWVAAGAGFALLALVEYAGWRRPSALVTASGLSLGTAAFVLTLGDSLSAAVAFGVLTVWGLWRHVMPPDWLPRSDEFGFVPALAAFVTTIAVWDLSPLRPALLVTAALVLAVAVAGRLWRPIADDVLWQWFVPAAAGALTMVSMGLTWGEFPVEVAVASALAAVALVSSAIPIAPRVWLVSSTLVWSLVNVGEALDMSRNAQAVGFAVAALALVVGALAAARPIGVHLATIGHTVGFAALAAPSWPGWAATAVVAAATAGWLATTIVDERGEAVHLAAVRLGWRAGSDPDEVVPIQVVDLVDDVAPLVSLVGLWATVLLGVDAAGWISVDDSWAAAVSAGVALGAACVVRMVVWRRADRPVLAWATLIAAVLAASAAIGVAGSDRQDWSPVVGLVLGLAVIAVTAAPRPAAFRWTGWFGGAVLTLFVVDRLGLDRDWMDVALAGWGAGVLIAGLTVHRVRQGPDAGRGLADEHLLLPPAVLGAIAFVVGGLAGLSEGSAAGIGWTALGMSAVMLVVALLLPLGALVGLAEALATAAYILLAPWEPLDRPWTFVPLSVVLLGLAWVMHRTGRQWWARWDLPSFLVAHAVAGLALLAAVDADSIVLTFALVGAVSIAIAVVLRRWPWAAAGAALVLVAGADAGHGWLALVLLVEGLALTVTGLLRVQPIRWALLGLGAVSLVGAWFALAAWQSWETSTLFYATVPGAAGIALLAAVGLRTAVVPRELAGVWAITGSAVFLSAAALSGDVARRPGGLTLAGSLLLLAAAAAVTATVLGGGMRWLAAALAAVAWMPAVWGLDPSATTATLIGTGVALAALTAALTLHGLRPAAVWLAPVSFYAAATQALAASAAVSVLPDDDLVIVVLLAVGAELVAFGVLTGRPELHLLAPVAACGAWLIYAGDALAGDANWFTVPIGLTMLVMVGLLRWIRRGRGGDPSGWDVIALELVGMTFLVASALAQTLAGHLWNGVLAIGIGVLVAGWGVVTRVRWRAGFGAADVVLAGVLLIGVPLSKSVTWTGPALWVTLSAIGVAAIGVASALERSRDRMRKVARRLDEMTAGWERLPGRSAEDEASLPPPPTGAEAGLEPSDEPQAVS